MYDTTTIIEDLTLEKILEKTTEFDIYSHYIGNKFILGRVIKSPLREKDNHPSFGIFKCSKTGNLLFKDQATGVSGDCVKFVRLLFNIRYKKALEKIYEEVTTKSDFGTNLKKEFKGKRKILSIKRKNWTQTDDEYWSKYHINRETLNNFNVVPIDKYWIDDKVGSLYYTKEQPMYAFRIFNAYKIYRPNSPNREDKWRSNCLKTDIQGWEQLPESGDLLIITKSLKDVMVLSLFNIPSIAPQSEVSTLPKEVILEAKKRFKRLVVLFDNDDAGIKGANDLKEKYDLEILFISKHFLDLYGIKDVSDYISIFGKESTEILLNYNLKTQ